MSDKVRGAIFNMLGDIDGLTVLDAFAGSGALCFEALSRGARLATAIDVDKGAISTIKANANALGLGGRVKAIRANVSSWADNNPEPRFDLVLLDPPYDDVKMPLLAKMAGFAQPGGIVVLSLPPTADSDLGDAYELLSSKSYGDATLSFFRRVS